MTWPWNSCSNDISNNISNEFSVLQPNIVPLCKGGISQVIVPGYTRVSTRVPETFSPQHVDKEFQQVNSHWPHQTMILFLSICQPGHEANLVEFLF